ncbi:MAG: DUF1549 and DUF1553 domain-containing protein [Pirellulaceae bacterium]|nr:DUF1549 and DUF1553 domain-containing protein [Pirellulaceae bacterium]
MTILLKDKPVRGGLFRMTLSVLACFSICCGDMVFSWDESGVTAERITPAESTQPAVSFSREIQPILTKLGCATLSCHGAFRGQGEFRLSLFGRQRHEDYDNLCERINLQSPTDSLLLQKPTLQLDHEGGEVLHVGSKEHEILLRWLTAGAPFDDLGPPQQLKIDPPEVVVQHDHQATFRVSATWGDDQWFDVTDLVTFKVVDENIAAVDERGNITTKAERTSTSVVAQLGTTAAHAVILAPSSKEKPTAVRSTQNPLDHFIDRRLDLLGIEASDDCTDAEFIRRVMLDVCGRLPTVEEMRAFVADEQPGKRRALIDTLLVSEDHALTWASWLAELTGCVAGSHDEIRIAAYHMEVSQEAFANMWIDWFRTRLQQDIPYDEMIEGLLLATTREDKSYLGYLLWLHQLRSRAARDAQAGDFYAARATNDLFWHVYSQQPDLYPTLIASSLVGVQLECARCHDHPMDFWTQKQFQGFDAIFRGVSNHRAPDLRKSEKQNAIAWISALGGTLIMIAVALNFVAIRRRRYWLATGLLCMEASLVAFCVYFAAGYLHVFDQADSPAVMSPGLKIILWLESQHLDNGGVVAGICLLGLSVFVGVGAFLYVVRRRAWTSGRLVFCRAGVAFVLTFAGLTVSDAVFVSRQVRTRTPLLNYYRHSWLTFRETALRAAVPSPTNAMLMLDGTVVDMGADTDPRQAFMAWLRRTQTSFLAKNIVNRVWSVYFGRGLIDPAGDMSELNPATHPALLSWLVEDFIESGFSLRHLHQTILNSKTYQRSWRTNDSNYDLPQTYARFHPRRLMGRQLLHAIVTITGGAMNYGLRDSRPITSAHRMLGIAPTSKASGAMAARLFCAGSDGAQNEMRVEGALYLLVDPAIQAMIKSPDGKLARLLASHEREDDVAAELYLQMFGRKPDEQERQVIQEHLARASDPQRGYEDLMWALINTEEFQFNH